MPEAVSVAKVSEGVRVATTVPKAQSWPLNASFLAVSHTRAAVSAATDASDVAVIGACAIWPSAKLIISTWVAIVSSFNLP